MSRQKIFCVYDCKAEAYMSPFFMQTRGVAVRSFTEAANDPQSGFYKYPADYTLFELGEYDEEVGGFELHKAKVNLGTALDFKNNVVPMQKAVENNSVEITQEA